MKKWIQLASAGLLVSGVVAPLAVDAEDFSVVMITDVGGVDDKSFNQSAWEGLVAWGEENNVERGKNGYDYIQSDDDSEFVGNINTAVEGDFDLVFGIGFKLEPALQDAVELNPEQNFVIVDSVIEGDNAASLNFKDNEAAFLAGVAAALTTETNHVGFVGGQEGFIIGRFEAGFVAGVKAVNPDIEISIEYAASFGDAAKGKQIAAAMYANDVDVIYHASGDTGNGVFSEAKDLVTNDPTRNLWVIGVDRDQEEEGIVEINGEERHLTLTSTLKAVGTAMKDFIEQTQADGFKAGDNIYGLAEDGVGLTDGQLSDEVIEKIAEYKQMIIDGEIEVPEAPEN